MSEATSETPDAVGIWARGSIRPGKAAKRYGVGRTWLYGEMQAGRLVFAKIGRMRVLPIAALEELLAAHMVGSKSAAK